MGPITETDGHDLPGLINQAVPSLAAYCDDFIEGVEDPVG